MDIVVISNSKVYEKRIRISQVLTAWLSYYTYHKFCKYVELSFFFYKTVNTSQFFKIPLIYGTWKLFSCLNNYLVRPYSCKEELNTQLHSESF